MSRILAIYSFTVGVFCVGLWPHLPGLLGAIGLFLFTFLLFYLKQNVIAWLLGGICYGVCWGQYVLSHQLPEEINPSEFLITGEVAGLPSIEANRTRFNLRVMDSELLSIGKRAISKDNLIKLSDYSVDLKKLRLNWYNPSSELMPGQIWQLKVKLRSPRGMVNPDGFDYQAWLIRQGISATGYVREKKNTDLTSQNRLLTTLLTPDSYRFRLRSAIQHLTMADEVKSLIMALTLGDRSQMPDDLWDLLVLSGVVHLMVISGLHIGLIALFAYGVGVVVASNRGGGSLSPNALPPRFLVCRRP